MPPSTATRMFAESTERLSTAECCTLAENAACIVLGSKPRPFARAVAVSDVTGPRETTLRRLNSRSLRIEIVPLLSALEIELARGRQLAAIGEMQVGGEIERAHRAAEVHRAICSPAQSERGSELARGDERDRIEAHVGGHAVLAGIDHLAVRHHPRQLAALVMRQMPRAPSCARRASHRCQPCP